MTRWTVHSCGPTKFRGEVAVDGLLKGMTLRMSECQLLSFVADRGGQPRNGMYGNMPTKCEEQDTIKKG